jgi:ABC-type transport system involved in multi-copper enzyme maturation permease subunit
MIFASLVIEREPTTWAQLPAAVAAWLQDAGSLSALALFVWCLAYVFQRPAGVSREGNWVKTLFAYAAVGSFLLFGLYGVLLFAQNVQHVPINPDNLRAGTRVVYTDTQRMVGAAAGLLAIFAVALPVVVDLVTRIRWRRIWALALLSLKEARRRRVVWVFSAMALVFLFVDWFVPYRPADQVRNYVRVFYWSMTPLFLVTASLLGAFSIPADVKSQTIHTIVTKPVERYEIVLGRFIGYGILLTIGLAGMSLLSLLYVARGVSEEARQESYKARVPIFGKLDFSGTKGENVGREWEYRRYITGPNPQMGKQPTQYAVWSFPHLPSDLVSRAKDDKVRFEFGFDIFRTTKGKEAHGVFCTFMFAPGKLEVPQIEALKQEREQLVKKSPKGVNVTEEMINRHGFYELGGKEIFDYQTSSVDVPVSLVQKLVQAQTGDEPALKVLVNVDKDKQGSQNQLVGVAQPDFYLLATEMPFWQNYLKGTIGLWYSMMLVLGLAVALSTYLSGIISWLVTMFLFLAGYFLDYIQTLAAGRIEGGGSMEAAFRLFNRSPLNAPLDQTATLSVLQSFDEGYRWALNRVLKIIPDVNRFDLTAYVAEGFNIPWGEVLFLDTFLPLVGYLLPWACLAFYLMKFREVANPR